MHQLNCIINENNLQYFSGNIYIKNNSKYFGGNIYTKNNEMMHIIIGKKIAYNIWVAIFTAKIMRRSILFIVITIKYKWQILMIILMKIK